MGTNECTCTKLGPVFSALAIAPEGIAIISVVPIALWLPARQPVHVDICCAEANANVPFPALADHLHLKVVDGERCGHKRICAYAGCILVCTARACRRARPAQIASHLASSERWLTSVGVARQTCHTRTSRALLALLERRTCVLDPGFLDVQMSTIASRAGTLLPSRWQDQAPLVRSH